MNVTMPPRLLVFDLDGTLIDSRIDLTNSVNAMLEHFGKPVLAPPIVASYIGDGASALVRRALAHVHLIPASSVEHHPDPDQPDPPQDSLIDEALAWFIGYYRLHKLDYTYVYPGVVDALAEIRSRHPSLPMAVLTNKPVGPARAICSHFGLDRFFFANYGGDSFPTKKPDPQGLLTLINQASTFGTPVTPAETIMIGDSHVDVETARACGARSLGCSFGLSPDTLAAAYPNLTVDRASDWPSALGL